MAEKRTTAGDRSHQMTIHAPAGTVEPTALDIETQVPVAIRAWPISAETREALQAGGVQNQTMYTVTMTYRTDMLQSFVLLEECCTQRRFQILSVVPTDRRDALDLTCVTSG